jgi:hypothetical protein
VLPWISAEVLWFSVGAEAACGVPLPSGDLPVHAAGRVMVMTEDEWRRYRTLCRDSLAFASGLVAEAA